MNSINSSQFISVKEASHYCYKMGLPRSAKSLRRWCANGEVDAQKRQVSNKQKRFIDRESLDIKIKEELQFLKHSEKPLPQTEQLAGHHANMSTHDRIQADASGHKRSQGDMSVRDRTQPDRQSQPQIRDLEDQILLLKKDAEWRDQLLKDQKKAT